MDYRTVVEVDLSDIIDNDLEGFLDILSEKVTGNQSLMDIQYKVVGTKLDGTDVILIEVTGYTEGEEEE